MKDWSENKGKDTKTLLKSTEEKDLQISIWSSALQNQIRERKSYIKIMITQAMLILAVGAFNINCHALSQTSDIHIHYHWNRGSNQKD